VVQRIPSAVQQADARVTGQPALDGPAGVRADVVEHDRDDRRRGVGVEGQLQELGEGGAGGALGDVVQPASGASSMAPKMLRFWSGPGVITSCRSPVTIQVDRRQGSRLTWDSSSARITAPSGRAAISWWSAASTAASSGSPFATIEGGATGLLAHSPGRGRQGYRRVPQAASKLLDRPGSRFPQHQADASDE